MNDLRRAWHQMCVAIIAANTGREPIEAVGRMLAERAVLDTVELATRSFDPLKAGGGLIGRPFARGGPVKLGSIYIAGEGGPEVVMSPHHLFRQRNPN